MFFGNSTGWSNPKVGFGQVLDDIFGMKKWSLIKSCMNWKLAISQILFTADEDWTTYLVQIKAYVFYEFRCKISLSWSKTSFCYKCQYYELHSWKNQKLATKLDNKIGLMSLDAILIKNKQTLVLLQFLELKSNGFFT